MQTMINFCDGPPSRTKRNCAIFAGIVALVAALALMARRPPVSLAYHVWNAVPGSVVDQDGRVGRLYSNASTVLEAVVFEKNVGPRHAGALDRWFVPPPRDAGIHRQITFDVQSLRCGTANSDEIFDEFLLSRPSGVGWNGDGAVDVKVVGKGRDRRYIATTLEDVITIRPK